MVKNGQTYSKKSCYGNRKYPGSHVHNATFLKYVWPFFNIIHKRVKCTVKQWINTLKYQTGINKKPLKIPWKFSHQYFFTDSLQQYPQDIKTLLIPRDKRVFRVTNKDKIIVAGTCFRSAVRRPEEFLIFTVSVAFL